MSNIRCPKCEEKTAKVSSTYPDIIVCYCGGNKLHEVGKFVDGKIIDHQISFDLNTIKGSFVSGIDKSYERSVRKKDTRTLYQL